MNIIYVAGTGNDWVDVIGVVVTGMAAMAAVASAAVAFEQGKAIVRREQAVRRHSVTVAWTILSQTKEVLNIVSETVVPARDGSNPLLATYGLTLARAVAECRARCSEAKSLNLDVNQIRQIVTVESYALTVYQVFISISEGLSSKSCTESREYLGELCKQIDMCLSLLEVK